ncbi:MAG: hypothetical protein JO208_11330, partial [Alphaproteobacteria bacterium]|nr:hypothetical protein [Alphaproteobacteria bacterium]
MPCRAALGSVLGALLATFFVPAARAAEYTVIDAPGAKNTTLALDVNASGTVTGWFLDRKKNYNGFLRAPDGSYQTFVVQGAQTEGNALNDKGVVAGGYFSSSLSFLFGYLRTSKGKLKPFDPQ